jgi:hypothetical protein
MRFERLDGSAVALSVIGYQFPAERTAEYDSNWLNVNLLVSHPRGSWKRTEPALLTYEVERLADWFEQLARGDRETRFQGFIEPNISFELIGNSEATLRIFFDLEFKPPWAVQDADEEHYLDFPLNPSELRDAAESLRSELKKYPQRAAR